MSDHWATRRVVVTGGAGFLGQVVCRKLEERGAKEVLVPRSASYDLTQPSAVAGMFSDFEPDVVIHLAARVGGIGANMERPAELYLNNLLMGTYTIEEARRRAIEKTVVLGTICAYPKFAPIPFREGSLWDGYPEETNAPYGIAKKALLVHAQANRLQYGQNAIFLLPVNLYGPGDKFNSAVSHVIPALIKKCVEAHERAEPMVEVWGTGKATREFLYVDDAAEGVLLAAEHYDDPEPVNLGANHEVSIKDLVSEIAGIVGYGGEIRWDPSRPDGQPRRRVDAGKARREFGFEATMPLSEGLRRTIDWYVNNRDLAEAATV